MKRTVIRVLLLVIVLLVGACQAGSASPNAAPTVPPATETPAPTPTPPLPAETPPQSTRGPANDVEPAPATLTIRGQSRLGGIGSYCWANICADMIGIPTMPEPMKAESPVAATLTLPFERSPQTVNLSVYRATDDAELDESAREYRWWRPEQEVQSQQLAPILEQDFTLELEPGLYILSVFAAVEDGGDVSYGFLVNVE